jgi:hypothetical protein
LHGEPENQRDVSRAIQAISGIGPPTNQQRQRTTRTGMCQYNLGAKMLTRRSTRRRRSESSPTNCPCFPIRRWYRLRFKDVPTVLRSMSRFKLLLCTLAAQLEGSRRNRCQQRPTCTVQVPGVAWYSWSAPTSLVWRRPTMEARQMTVRNGKTGGRQPCIY